MTATTWHNIKVRGDGLHPGDFIEKYDQTILHVRVHLGTAHITLDGPTQNGNENVTVSSDAIVHIQRPITTRGIYEGFETLP